VLDAARRAAEDALLARTVLTVSPKAHAEFLARLNASGCRKPRGKPPGSEVALSAPRQRNQLPTAIEGQRLPS
jgi:hypothetical protein